MKKPWSQLKASCEVALTFLSTIKQKICSLHKNSKKITDNNFRKTGNFSHAFKCGHVQRCDDNFQQFFMLGDLFFVVDGFFFT